MTNPSASRTAQFERPTYNDQPEREQGVAGAAHAVEEKVDGGLHMAAEKASGAAESIRERTEGRGDMLEDAGSAVATSIDRASGYLKEHSTEDLMRDLESYAREHPLQALGGAVVGGFLLGRILR